MAYKTLYRVYRPRRFDEVSGQEHITDILKKQVEQGKASHAYLFCGPRGTGKTSTAKIFANALNCTNPQDGNPCLECDVCKSFAQDNFVDIIEIDAASNNGVDNVRDIREKVSLLPAQGKYKVYIIDEVHMLSSGAFNALLKTLEEPPPHAVFILATTEARKVPATISSRCQKYDFKRLSEKDIVARLQYVAEQDGISYEEDALELIAQQAEGAMRDALSIMDQCIAGSEKLTREVVQGSVGIAGTVAIGELADAVMTEDAQQAVARLNGMLDDGLSPQNILRDLIVQLSGELARNANDAYQCSAILRSLEALINIQNTMRYSNVPGAVLLAAVVRATVNTTDVDTQDIELRLRKLEDRVERMKSNRKPLTEEEVHQRVYEAVQESRGKPKTADYFLMQEEPPAVKGAAMEPAKEESDSETAAGKVEMKEKLHQLREAIQKKNLALFPAVNAIHSIETKGGRLIAHISPSDEPVVKMLQSPANAADVADVMEQVFGGEMKIEIAHRTKKEAEPTEDLTQELLEIFGEDNLEIKSSKEQK